MDWQCDDCRIWNLGDLRFGFLYNSRIYFFSVEFLARYWALVIPFTFASAYLLLSKPKPKPAPKPDSSTALRSGPYSLPVGYSIGDKIP